MAAISQSLLSLQFILGKECKENKVGDTVKVITGSDKGKIGEVTEIFKHNSKVLVKDVNLKTKHMKSREKGEPGQIKKIEAPIHSSNVMLYSKEQNVASRVCHKVLADGKRVQYLIKTGKIIGKKMKEEKRKTAVAAS